MGTQRHGIGGRGNEPPRAQTPVDDDNLGIPADGPPMADDPTGFTPRAEPQMVAGRRVRQMQEKDLVEAHQRYAGKEPMFGAGSFGKGPTPEQRQSMPPPKVQATTATDESATRAAAQRLMPQYLTASAPPTEARQQRATQQPPSRLGPRDPEAEEQSALLDYQLTQTTAALEYLTKEETAARDRGDYLAAEQARNMANRLTEGFDIKRIPKKEGRHPALAKLLSNLGLERIQPTKISWGGSEWLFAPTSAKLDLWINDKMREDGSNFAALIIAAGTVGLDNVPIYEALSVPLDTRLIITDHNTGTKRTVDVALYRKFCDCGYELSVAAEECPNCNSAHDKFDIPADLRQKCAEVFYELIENKFGAYEELAYLLNEKNRVMKDRAKDKEELFPLAMPSPEQQRTAGSPSGDE